jgi:hypothetical protein
MASQNMTAIVPNRGSKPVVYAPKYASSHPTDCIPMPSVHCPQIPIAMPGVLVRNNMIHECNEKKVREVSERKPDAIQVNANQSEACRGYIQDDERWTILYPSSFFSRLFSLLCNLVPVPPCLTWHQRAGPWKGCEYRYLLVGLLFPLLTAVG